MGELSREGSTYFRPESVAKEGEESKGGKGKDGAEEKSKKKKIDPDAKAGAKKKIRKTKKNAEEEEAGEDGEEDEEEQEDTSAKPKKKPRKAKKDDEEADGSPLTCGERLGRLEQILLALNLGCESHTRFGFSALWPNSGTIRS